MSFDVVRHTGLPAQEAWRRITDWPRHSGLVPFTRVRGSASGVGATFVARTSIGPLGFDDPMEIVGWQPPTETEPGVCRIRKRGHVVKGSATLTVTPDSTGSSVSWYEDASLAVVGKLASWPNDMVGARVFGRAVDAILGDSSTG